MSHKESPYHRFPYEEFGSDKELKAGEQELPGLAREAAANAYAPYSKFHVGAAVLLENGKIITGSNQENAAYPSGLCAERVALFYASAHYPDVPVKAIAVAAVKDQKAVEAPVPPCGGCRQVFIEWEDRFEKPFAVIMAGSKKIIRTEKAAYLLPFSFQKDFL